METFRHVLSSSGAALAIPGVVGLLGLGWLAVRSGRRRSALLSELEALRAYGNRGRQTTDPLTVGKYRVIRKLGSGAMAKVYLAAATSGSGRVALKIPEPHLFQDEEHRNYFRQELSTGTKMQHPNVVRILDYSDGRDGEIPYIAMEFVDGVTLDRKLPRHRPVSVAYAASVLQAVTAALEYAHAMGVIHRDIKPENIMISRTGAVKVADFGIARDLWDVPRGEGEANTFAGSPHYMAPEQISCERIDYRADYYALGVLGFRLLTGHLPFDGDTALEVITRKVSQRAPPPSAYNQEIPLELEQLIRDLTQREPDLRPVAALPIRKVLKKFVPRPERRHRSRRATESTRTDDF